jgi:hypothetical protein
MRSFEVDSETEGRGLGECVAVLFCFSNPVRGASLGWERRLPRRFGCGVEALTSSGLL